MSETKMSDIIRASMEGIKSFTDMETVFGNAITTPQGVTVIPVSKISVGIATGGVDYGNKRFNDPQNFGGGGGSGLQITPLAFITVDRNSNINLIHLDEKESDVQRISSIIEKSPAIIEKIKSVLS